MVQEDERKLDAMSKRYTELTMVNNNSKLLNEMLDHYDKASCGAPEMDLLKELFESCEKMQPKLFRMAAETTDETERGAEAPEDTDGGGIVDILNSSDELTRVIDRYKMVIVQGKPDITKRIKKQSSDTLLDLDLVSDEKKSKESKNSSPLLEDDLLGLNLNSNATENKESEKTEPEQSETSTSRSNEPVQETLISASTIRQRTGPSIDDLLLDGEPITSAPILATSNIASAIPKHPSPFFINGDQHGTAICEKSSRQKGLEELDLLGEVAIKSHLPCKNERSPQFAKKNEKLSMNELQKRKKDKEFHGSISSSNQNSGTTHLPEKLNASSPISYMSGTTDFAKENNQNHGTAVENKTPSITNRPSMTSTSQVSSSSSCDIPIPDTIKSGPSERKNDKPANEITSKKEDNSKNVSKGNTATYKVFI